MNNETEEVKRYEAHELPERCPECDSSEYISSGPQFYVCRNCFLCQECDRKSAEVERLSKEIENLIWNLGGCDTIASGWSKPFDYNKEMARPALDSVSRLATKLEAAESKLSQLLAACEKFLKQTTGKSPEEIVAILNGGQQ